jgi:hypothetical protein
MVSNGASNEKGQGQQNGTPKASKILSDRPSKDGTAQRAALEVEGLKGYVSASHVMFYQTSADSLITATRRLHWEGSIWRRLQRSELGHWRDCGY